MDEAKVYSLYYSPVDYYSSKLVGEERSGLVLALLLRHSGQLPLITSSALLFFLFVLQEPVVADYCCAELVVAYYCTIV